MPTVGFEKKYTLADDESDLDIKTRDDLLKMLNAAGFNIAHFDNSGTTAFFFWANNGHDYDASVFNDECIAWTLMPSTYGDMPTMGAMFGNRCVSSCTTPGTGDLDFTIKAAANGEEGWWWIWVNDEAETMSYPVMSAGITMERLLHVNYENISALNAIVNNNSTLFPVLDVDPALNTITTAIEYQDTNRGKWALVSPGMSWFNGSSSLRMNGSLQPPLIGECHLVPKGVGYVHEGECAVCFGKVNEVVALTRSQWQHGDTPCPNFTAITGGANQGGYGGEKTYGMKAPEVFQPDTTSWSLPTTEVYTLPDGTVFPESGV